MNLADMVSKPANRAPIITISGDAGTGKTTLAATFPNPIFIRAEDGMQAIPEDVRPDAFDVLNTYDEALHQIKMLIRSEHDYKTLVVDSVTQLDSLTERGLLASDTKHRPDNLHSYLGGFGKGVAAMGAKHSTFRFAVDQLAKKRNMTIIFIAHPKVVTIEKPDLPAYTTNHLDLGKNSWQPYVDNVDMVIYLKKDMSVRGGGKDGGRAMLTSGDYNVAVCHNDGCNISKNRYNITEELIVDKGVNPFIEHIPYLQQFYK